LILRKESNSEQLHYMSWSEDAQRQLYHMLYLTVGECYQCTEDIYRWEK